MPDAYVEPEVAPPQPTEGQQLLYEREPNPRRTGGRAAAVGSGFHREGQQRMMTLTETTVVERRSMT